MNETQKRQLGRKSAQIFADLKGKNQKLQEKEFHPLGEGGEYYFCFKISDNLRKSAANAFFRINPTLNEFVQGLELFVRTARAIHTDQPPE